MPTGQGPASGLGADASNGAAYAYTPPAPTVPVPVTGLVTAWRAVCRLAPAVETMLATETPPVSDAPCPRKNSDTLFGLLLLTMNESIESCGAACVDVFVLASSGTDVVVTALGTLDGIVSLTSPS